MPSPVASGSEALATEPSRWRNLTRSAAAVSSATLAIGIACAYLARPDGLAAITVFPLWVWWVPGGMLTVFALRGQSHRLGWRVVAGWLLLVLAMAEEPWSLGRAFARIGLGSPTLLAGEEAILVVSINCAGGSRLAAEEVLPYRPDIVLLQESPSREDVQALALRFFGENGGYAYGVEASILARGTVVAATLPGSSRGVSTQARVTLPSGRQVDVVSLRLVPAVFRADLWSPACWQEQAANRKTRRAQMSVIANRMVASPVPVIVGGDFNAPQGDAIYRALRPQLRDAFDEAGSGWGNTILNDVAALRIDQIWISDALRARSVVARKTRHSDHRLVVSDLALAEIPRDVTLPPPALSRREVK